MNNLFAAIIVNSYDKMSSKDRRLQFFNQEAWAQKNLFNYTLDIPK